jgi:hypothetical protein
VFAKITHALLNFISGICFLRGGRTGLSASNRVFKTKKTAHHSTMYLMQYVKFSFMIKHQVMEWYWGVEVKLNAALEMCALPAFIPRKRTSRYKNAESPSDSRLKEKALVPSQNQTPVLKRKLKRNISYLYSKVTDSMTSSSVFGQGSGATRRSY